MSALSVVRGGAVGLTAVVVPAIALGVSDVFILRGWGAFLGLLSVTCVLVGTLAWVCVRVAHFPPALAICLTALSFGILVLMTLLSHVNHNSGGFVFCFAQLLVAVLVAWAATRLARR